MRDQKHARILLDPHVPLGPLGWTKEEISFSLAQSRGPCLVEFIDIEVK